MRRIMFVIFIWLFFIPCNVYALSTTEAVEKIDVMRNCSLTLYYDKLDYKLDNINIKIYDIASVLENFSYQLSSNFSNYPIVINGIKTDYLWNVLEDTLNSYILADNIKETFSYSIKDYVLEISDLHPGLYFVKTEQIDTDNYKLLFDSFLISVPNLEEDGTWNYDVSVYPKVEEYIPNYQKINYTVVKQWIDNKENRPDSIDIDIYKDGVFMKREVLSSSNSWMCNFDGVDDGSEWSVIERNIPSNYNVSILKNENNFIIVNTSLDYKSNNPKTIDNIYFYFYLFIISFIGIILLIIGLMIRKKMKI